MRWYKKPLVDEDLLNRARSPRLVIRFLWKPLTLNDETRWLEFAVIRQVYELISPMKWVSGVGENEDFWYWKDVEWER